MPAETAEDIATDAAIAAAEETVPADGPARQPISVRRFLSDTVIFGFVQTFDRAIGFFLLPLTTSLMSNQEYGLLSLFSTIAEILFYVVALGMLTSFFRHYTEATESQAKDQILNATFWTITATACCAAAVLIPFSRLWGHVLFPSANGSMYVVLAVPFTYFAVLLSLVDCRVQADGKAWTFLGVNLLQVVTTRGLALLLISLGLGAFGWIVGSIVGQLLSLSVFAFLVLRGISLRVDAALLRKLVPYGVVLLPTAVSAWLMYGVTKYLIVWNSPGDPLNAIALYSVGERISQVMYMLSLAFILGWRRFAFSNMHHAEGQRLLGSGVTVFLTITGFAAVGLIALGDDLMRWMIPSRMWKGIPVIPYLTLAGFFWGVGEVMNIGMHKARKTKLMSSLYVVGAALNLVLNLALIPWLGIVGAAMSLMTCEFVKTALIWWTAQRAYPLEIAYRRLAMAIGVFAPILLVCSVCFPETTLATTAIQAGLVALGPVLLIGMGFLTPGERAAIADIVLQARRTVRAR